MTDHKWNPTASALCSCGESPNGYSLPTDSAQWMKWEVWHREHLDVSDVQMTATDSERDERMQRLAALTVADAGSNAMTVLAKDVLRWLDTLTEQAATIKSMTTLLSELTDPDDCWYDHHGGCQAHGYLWLKPGETCPNAEAKAIIAAQKTEAENEESS